MKTINDIKNAVLSGNRVFWKNDSYEVIKDSKNQWMIAFRQGQSGENYVGLTYRDGVKSDYNPKDFYIKGKSVNMKIEDNFYGKRVVKGIFAKAWSGKSAKLNKYGNYAIVAADADGNAKGFANRTQAQNFSDRNNLGGVKDPSSGGSAFYVYIKDPSSEEKKTLSRTGSKAMFNFRDVGDAHQKAIAIKTLKNPSWALTGGITAEEAESILRKKFKYTDKQIAELKKYEGSRTGSKAKFATSKFEVGSTYEMRWDSQNFSHYKVLERTASTVKIEDIGNRVTNPDSSDASMRSKGVVIPQKGETVRVKIHTSGDGEFCFPTGRYSMSPTLKASKKVFARQGSKTKFANGVYGNEEIAKGLSQVLKSLGFDAMASGILTGPKDNETLRKYIRALKSKMSPMSSNERGMFLLQTLEKQLASRTGAKAKFAVVGDIVKVRQGQKSVKGEIVKDNGDGTYMIELPNQLYSDGRKIIERVSEARLLLSRTGAKVFK